MGVAMFWGHMYDSGWGWFGAGFMMVFWVALLGVAVWAIVRLTNRADSRPAQPAAGADEPSAQDVLDRRLASGEITVEEHTRLSGHLGGLPR